MNKQKFLRRPAAILIAVLLIGALSITALACDSGGIIYRIGDVIYQFISDGAEQDSPEDAVTVDLTDPELDVVVVDSYEYIEEDDGTVRVSLGGAAWTDVD